MQEFFTTAEVAAMAGVHRDTLLRWLRKQEIPEPQRNRHGWRVFTASEANAVVDYTKAGKSSVEGLPQSDEFSLARLKGLGWDFESAKTGYLTHNLHPYPAKFIPQIPNALIQELSTVGDTIADIFCGSGTTLLEALQLKRNAVGIDANPLAALISRAKTTALTDSEFDELEAHKYACGEIIEQVISKTGDLFHDGKVFQSLGWRPDPKICKFWFEPFVIEELAELRALIFKLSSEAVRTLCTVVFSSIIVSVSKQDSDTRYVRREKTIEPGDAVLRYLVKLSSAVSAVREVSDLIEDRFSCQIHSANLLDSPETDMFDLVVTSPPYPNAYSYHLYHRTRLIWLGHDPKEFKGVEIGSHRKYSARGRNRATSGTFRTEFEQIFYWLRNRLRHGRHACFVIGDSTIDKRRVNNTELLSKVGANHGFREVARINRTIKSTRKAFNPKLGKIKTENILILRKV